MTITLPPQAINITKPTTGAALNETDAKEVKLFSPSTMRSVTLSNRIIVR
jgi:hypothetical protein